MLKATLVMIIGALGIGLLGGALGGGLGSEPGSALGAVVPLGLAALFVPTIVYMTFAQIQRAHDLNLSGWYVLLTLVPFIGLVFFLYLSLAPAKAEVNRFGARREPSMVDKVLGIGSLALAVLSVIGAIALMLTGAIPQV